MYDFWLKDLPIFLDSTQLLLLFTPPMQNAWGSILANAAHCTCTPCPNHGSLLRATWQGTALIVRTV